MPSKPRTTGLQKHRANTQAITDGDTEEQITQNFFKLNYYFPFLDHIISHFNTRFPEELKSALKGTLLLPGHHQFLNEDIESEIKLEFSNDLPMPSAFEQEVLRWKFQHQASVVKMSLIDGATVCDKTLFPNISTIFYLILCLPVGTCT